MFWHLYIFSLQEHEKYQKGPTLMIMAVNIAAKNDIGIEHIKVSSRLCLYLHVLMVTWETILPLQVHLIALVLR